MHRCMKLWTSADQKSHFEEGFIHPEPGARGDALSVKFPIASASCHETDADPKLGWHPDADRQLVITLSGTLEFETPDGRFALRPGDILFTEDTSGAGHNWKMWMLNLLGGAVRGTGNMALPSPFIPSSLLAHVLLSPFLIFGWR